MISLLTTLQWPQTSAEQSSVSFPRLSSPSLTECCFPGISHHAGLLTLCAHPSASNSLSHLLPLTLLPPSQHSSCGSFFGSKISPLGSHSNLCICLYYHLSSPLVHVKSPIFDCEFFKCRNCVLILLTQPCSPFYLPLVLVGTYQINGGLNRSEHQTFTAFILQLKRSKGSGPKQMCTCPLG